MRETLTEKPAPEPIKEVKREVISAPPAPIPLIASSTLPAQAGELIGAVGATDKGSTLPWLLGVTLLVAVSVLGYSVMLRSRTEPTAADELRKEAAKFDIIE
jgi:mannitol-specific phosphotransferase system IIBC component